MNFPACLMDKKIMKKTDKNNTKDPGRFVEGIHVEEDCLDYPATRDILARAGDIPVDILKSGSAGLPDFGLYPQSLSQGKRQAALNGFRNGTFQILVATDIAARGIDVSQISHVINYDIPSTPEAYIHRIGRTGRATRTGDAFTLITAEDLSMAHAIDRVLGSRVERRTLPDFDYGPPASADARRSRETSKPVKHWKTATPSALRRPKSSGRRSDWSGRLMPAAASGSSLSAVRSRRIS